MMPISKHMFVKCITSITNLDKFKRDVLDLIQEYSPYADLGILDYPSCDNELFLLLEEITKDNDGLIGIYLYEDTAMTVDELWEALQKNTEE